MDKVTVQKLLSQNQWYASQEEELQHWLLDNGKLEKYDIGEALFLRGDPQSGVYALIEGAIRVSGLNQEGSEAILTLLESGTWFGEASLFDLRERTHDAIAESSVEVLHVDQQRLEHFLAENPHYWRNFGVLLAHKLRLSFVALEDLALLPAKVRLARRLVQIATAYGEKESSQLLPVTVPQDVLGRMLSISRQTTNQILKELEAKGLIEQSYGRIDIKDIFALKEFCQLSAN